MPHYTDSGPSVNHDGGHLVLTIAKVPFIQVIFSESVVLEVNESMKYFLAVMGMVMIVEGLPYFAFPDKMKQVIRQVLEVEDAVLRRFGLFLMGLGLAVVYLGQRG